MANMINKTDLALFEVSLKRETTGREICKSEIQVNRNLEINLLSNTDERPVKKLSKHARYLQCFPVEALCI